MPRYTRERVREELRHRHVRVVVQQRDQPAQFDAIRMRLDLLWLRRQFLGRARVVLGILAWIRVIWISVVQRDMWIGNGRLLQVLIDAAAAANKLGLQLD